MSKSYLAVLVGFLCLPTAVAVAEPLDPSIVIRTAVEKNPQMAELALSVRESELDASAQSSVRPWTVRSDGGFQLDEQPSVGVIDTGVRQTTTIRASAELLKQFVYGTSLSFRIDLSRTVSQIPFNVPDLNIQETRTIGPNWFASARLQATQPLLKGRDRRANELSETLANKQVDIARLQREQAANALVAEALEAYWRWVAAQLDLTARTQSLERTRVLSDATIAQIEAGQLAELERDIVAQRIAAAEQGLVASEAAVLDAAETLRGVMGERFGVVEAWEAPVVIPTGAAEVPGVEATLEAARQFSPEVALLQQQITATKLATVRSKDLTRPQLDAVASLAQVGLSEEIGTSLEQLGTFDFTSWFLGFSLAIPLDNKLATRSLEADEVAVLRAETQREDAMREVELRVRQATRLLQTQRRRLALSKTETALGRKNLGAMQAKFEAGLASYLEVLQLEEDLQSAEQRYNQARIDALTSRIALDRLAGTLLTTWGVELK